MPELPEVETIKAGLEKIIFETSKPPVGIRDSAVLSPKLRERIPKRLGRLKGERIHRLERRAKYLLFHLEGGVLLNHLGMTGSWRVDEHCDRKNHDHFYLQLDNGLRLVYRDPRRFGVLDWVASTRESARLQKLGPEPLGEQFCAEALYRRLKGKKVAVKVAIMDQALVVGVGNIYAAEALFRAAIRPGRRSDRLTRAECEVLVKHIKEVLREAIAAGGSTISDFRQAGGSAGYFQHRFKVYGRAGEACEVCEALIKQKVLGQRSSFYCPVCQAR